MEFWRVAFIILLSQLRKERHGMGISGFEIDSDTAHFNESSTTNFVSYCAKLIMFEFEVNDQVQFVLVCSSRFERLPLPLSLNDSQRYHD